MDLDYAKRIAKRMELMKRVARRAQKFVAAYEVCNAQLVRLNTQLADLKILVEDDLAEELGTTAIDSVIEGLEEQVGAEFTATDEELGIEPEPTPGLPADQWRAVGDHPPPDGERVWVRAS